MSKLGQLLSNLERSDVTAIVFATGAPATLTTSSRAVPVTVTPLTEAQIRRFFDGTPVIERIPSSDTDAQTVDMSLVGTDYQVSIGRKGAKIEIKVSVAGGVGATTKVPSALTRPRRTDDAPRRSSSDRGSTRPSSAARAGHNVSAPRGRARSVERIDTSRAPSSGRSDAVGGGQRASRGIDIGSAPVVTERDSAAAPPSERALSAKLERGFGLEHGGPGRPPPSMEVLGAGLERDLEEDGAPNLVAHPDSAKLLEPDLPPIERNEFTSDASSIAVEDAPIDIETNSYELGSVDGLLADASPPLAFESTAVDTGPAAPPPVAAPAFAPAPLPAAAPGPAPAAPTTPSLANASDWQPGEVSPQLLQLLANARREGASDVHLVADSPPRVRRAGALESVGGPVPAPVVASLVGPLLRPAHALALQERGYADFALELPTAGRLRINVCRQRTGLKACFRLVVDRPRPIDALGLPTEVRKLLAYHQGLVIVSGPNGHGKTTSMAALVDMYNAAKPLHIITVEDPVEVIHPRKAALVTQREVGTHTRTFQTALAAALREDPDVIAIGELRDRDTVEMALAAAETGHLVLATMSTPSGAKTIDRLIDMFPPDDQSQVRSTLAGALKLVLSQRLLRRRDGRGAVAAFEMITGNVPLWALIQNNKLFQLPSLLQRGRNFGMIRLDESLRTLVAEGVVDRDEALLFADDPRMIEVGSGSGRVAGRR